MGNGIVFGTNSASVPVCPHGNPRRFRFTPALFITTLLSDWPAEKLQEAKDKGSLRKPVMVAESLVV